MVKTHCFVYMCYSTKMLLNENKSLSLHKISLYTNIYDTISLVLRVFFPLFTNINTHFVFFIVAQNISFSGRNLPQNNLLIQLYIQANTTSDLHVHQHVDVVHACLHTSKLYTNSVIHTLICVGMCPIPIKSWLFLWRRMFAYQLQKRASPSKLKCAYGFYLFAKIINLYDLNYYQIKS